MREAAELAPDLYADAQRAARLEEERLAGGDAAAALDHRTEARLLMEAAVTEAERVRLETTRLRMMEEETVFMTDAFELEHQRRQLEEEVRLRDASRVAIEEARTAFELAEAAETRRRPGTEAQLGAATAVLRRQIQFFVAKARAEGRPAEDIARVSVQLETASATSDAREKLRALYEVYWAASALLEAPNPEPAAPSSP